MTSWKDTFQSLKALGQFVIVEDEINDQFLIRPIVRISEKSVSIRHFDGVGEWVDTIRIAYKDITTVKFGCRYVHYHQKHIQRLETGKTLKEK